MISKDEIENFASQRTARSDAEVLAELRSFVALPDASDSAWSLDGAWDQAHLLTALAKIVAERKLESGIALVLDKMCYGDPGELMRSLRHFLEAAISPHWDRLTQICVSRATSDRVGTRYWAIAELGTLRDPTALPVILERFFDEREVAVEAFQAASMMLQTHPNLRPHVMSALRRVGERRADLRSDAAHCIASIQREQPARGPIAAPDAEAQLVSAIVAYSEQASSDRRVADTLELVLFRCLTACDEWDGSLSPDGVLTTRVQLESPGSLELCGHLVWLPGGRIDPVVASIALDPSRRAIESATIKLGDANAGLGATPYGNRDLDPARISQWVFVFTK